MDLTQLRATLGDRYDIERAAGSRHAIADARSGGRARPHRSPGAARIGARALAKQLSVVLRIEATLESDMNDPYMPLRDRALASVLDGPAHSDSALRHAAARNENLPTDLQYLVAKVHAHAYRVTDDDVARAQKVYGDDKLFEIIVSAAIGASKQRLDAGLDALEDA